MMWGQGQLATKPIRHRGRTAESFLRDQQGLETVEYAIIVGLVVAAVVATIAALGVWVAGVYNSLKNNVGA